MMGSYHYYTTIFLALFLSSIGFSVSVTPSLRRAVTSRVIAGDNRAKNPYGARFIGNGKEKVNARKHYSLAGTRISIPVKNDLPPPLLKNDQKASSTFSDYLKTLIWGEDAQKPGVFINMVKKPASGRAAVETTSSSSPLKKEINPILKQLDDSFTYSPNNKDLLDGIMYLEALKNSGFDIRTVKPTHLASHHQEVLRVASQVRNDALKSLQLNSEASKESIQKAVNELKNYASKLEDNHRIHSKINAIESILLM